MHSASLGAGATGTELVQQALAARTTSRHLPGVGSDNDRAHGGGCEPSHRWYRVGAATPAAVTSASRGLACGTAAPVAGAAGRAARIASLPGRR
jgi:hypothetical protein